MYEVAHHFFEGAGYPNELVQAADGKLYGTASQGGTGYGIVFVLTPVAGGGWTRTELHRFNQVDGAFPSAASRARGLTATSTASQNRAARRERGRCSASRRRACSPLSTRSTT